jgi:hypothetical protein
MKSSRRRRSGFMLMMVLVIIVLVSIVVAGFANHSLKVAVNSQASERNVQRKWAQASCQRVALELDSEEKSRKTPKCDFNRKKGRQGNTKSCGPNSCYLEVWRYTPEDLQNHWPDARDDIFGFPFCLNSFGFRYKTGYAFFVEIDNVTDDFLKGKGLGQGANGVDKAGTLFSGCMSDPNVEEFFNSLKAENAGGESDVITRVSFTAWNCCDGVNKNTLEYSYAFPAK